MTIDNPEYLSCKILLPLGERHAHEKTNPSHLLRRSPAEPTEVIAGSRRIFVTSAYGFTEASRICRLDNSFDLIVLGHTVPRNDKITLIELLRPNCKAPVLSIRKHGVPPLREAEFSIDSDNEREVLATAAQIALGVVRSKPASSSSASS